jgi:lipoprotein-anchoring transpeptidase ErfK/SrfK
VLTATHQARIIVDLYRGRLEAWEDGVLIAQGAIASGAGDTPTPPGGFFVTEIQEHTDPASGGTTWLIGTSAYSEALDPTTEGDPAVAILAIGDASHLSQATSLGCVRIQPDVLERLALLPLGTPVQILG